MSQKVFFATPSYDGQVHVFTSKALWEERNLLQAAGIECTWEPYAGCCYLPVARNQLVHKFLHSGCTDLIFVDADVEWKPGAVQQLLKHDRDVVAGLYPYKTYPVNFPVVLQDPPYVDKKTGLIEAAGLPTGFMRIKMQVFYAMLKAYGERNLMVVDKRDPENVQKYYCFLNTVKEELTWWGEDLYFCKKYREIGGRVWIEPNITLHHHGMHRFTGNYLDYIDQVGNIDGSKEEPDRPELPRIAGGMRA